MQVDRCWVVGANGSSVDFMPSLDGAWCRPLLMKHSQRKRASLVTSRAVYNAGGQVLGGGRERLQRRPDT